MHASISLPSFKITILTSRLPIPVPILAPPIAARTEAQESRRGAAPKMPTSTLLKTAKR